MFWLQDLSSQKSNFQHLQTQKNWHVSGHTTIQHHPYQLPQIEIHHRIVVTPLKESKPTQHQLEKLTRAFAILPTVSALALAACVEFVPAGTKHVKHVGYAWFEACGGCNRTGCTSDPLALGNNTSPCLDLQEVFQQSNARSCQLGVQYAWILTLDDTIAIHPEASADAAVAGASAALVVGPWWCPGNIAICWMPFGPLGSACFGTLHLKMFIVWLLCLRRHQQQQQQANNQQPTTTGATTCRLQLNLCDLTNCPWKAPNQPPFCFLCEMPLHQATMICQVLWRFPTSTVMSWIINA